MKNLANFLVEEVVLVEGIGLVLTGQTLNGVIVAGMKTNVMGKEIEIFEIKLNKEKAEAANVGQKAELIFKKNPLKKEEMKRGAILTFYN